MLGISEQTTCNITQAYIKGIDKSVKSCADFRALVEDIIEEATLNESVALRLSVNFINVFILIGFISMFLLRFEGRRISVCFSSPFRNVMLESETLSSNTESFRLLFKYHTTRYFFH